jgi:hypothetical protein
MSLQTHLSPVQSRMGGDGGVIAVKRKFIKECKTEDNVRSSYFFVFSHSLSVA